jgi:glutamine synthetase
MAHRRDPGPSAIRPRDQGAGAAENLGEAVSALRRSAVFRKGFGDAFVDYFAHIKEAEFARFTAETGGEADVTAWEHNEYFDLF